MVTKPFDIWKDIKYKSPTVSLLVIYLLLPIMLFYTTAILGNLYYTSSIICTKTILSVFLQAFFLPISVLFLSSWIIYKISKPLGTNTTFLENFTMVIYSSIPYFIVHIFVSLFDLHIYFEAIGVYSIFIYFTACKRFISITERHFISFIFISALIFLSINTIVNYIIGTANLFIYLAN